MQPAEATPPQENEPPSSGRSTTKETVPPQPPQESKAPPDTILRNKMAELLPEVELPSEHSGLWPDWGKCITYCASRKPPVSRQQILACIGKPDFTDTDPNEQWPKIKKLFDKKELTPEELPF